jgi:hypothetical protein
MCADLKKDVPVVQQSGLQVANFDVKVNEQFLDTNEDNASILPILKINYRFDSKIAKPGEFVLQQKVANVVVDDKGKSTLAITEQGFKVDKIVVLKVRYQYNYYDNSNPKNNCRSKIYKPFETGMVGNKYGYTCGPACPYREKGKNPKCNAQINVYANTLVEGKWVDCVLFFHGVAYMPFNDFYKDLLTGVLINGTKTKIPVFRAVIGLESFAEQKGANPYWVPVFKVVDLISDAELPAFKLKLDAVLSYVEAQNKVITRNNPGMRDDYDNDADSVEDSAIVDAEGKRIKDDEIDALLNEEVS